MKFQLDERILLRTILALLLIAIAAVLRIAPHPWNLIPAGAIAAFGPLARPWLGAGRAHLAPPRGML